MIASAAGSQLVAQAEPAPGPPYDFATELMGGGTVIPLKNAAMITKTEHGYLYRAGQQDSRLVMRRVKGGLRFVDTGTARFKKLAGACREKKVKVGVAAVCRVPGRTSASRPLLIEVWPRLGDDFVDGASLPATVALAVLGDAGHDVVRLGAGPDFFNGAFGRDRVSGGAGNDWLRAGSGNDRIWGGPGDDQLVGVDGADTIYGGDGDDRVGGGPGNDRLRGGAGADHVLCGSGADGAKVDEADSVRDCESVDHG